MGNLTLQAEVQGQIQQLQNLPNAQQERALDKPLNETSKKGISLGNEEEMHEEPPRTRKRWRDDILFLIESRWTFMSRPIHGMAALLYPFYKTPELFYESDLLTLKDEYINDLFEEQEQLAVNAEMCKYMNNLGPSFSRQDCSAGACERKWSAYSLIHTKIENRLSTSQLEKLVYCRANMRLVRTYHALGTPKQVWDFSPFMVHIVKMFVLSSNAVAFKVITNEPTPIAATIIGLDDFDFAHEEASDDTPMLVNYLVTRLQQAMSNPALQGEVQQQLHAYGILPPFQQERDPERFQGETSKRGLSTEKGVENPYQELKQLLEGKPSSKKKGHAQHERSPSREREESESQNESMEDVAPRRRRAQRSPTPTKRKRSPHSPHHRESKREEKNSKKKKERKRSPSSPSSSPSSSSDEGSGYSSQEKQRRGHRRSYAAWKRSSKLKKFKEGGKNISFLTNDGTFGATDTVLAFIQQFDAAFGDEGFTESSKLRHVAMHFQKSARQWWASLRANGEAPKTWKALRTSIMKQFLTSDSKPLSTRR
ncbi:hypothetical protein L7F22_036510 [Adiantum nelumboides]|nr:hypothetical protein [Adiantum nelumboides]